MIVIDVWGGENSMEHVARFLRAVDDALEIARAELAAGYLVNLRGQLAWGAEQDFDNRTRH